MGAFDKIKSGLLGMDVYRGDRIYLHPLKVWNRYSTRMFLPHSCSLQQGEEYRFETVDGGVAMSRYYQLVEEEEEKNQDQTMTVMTGFSPLRSWITSGGYSAGRQKDRL